MKDAEVATLVSQSIGTVIYLIAATFSGWVLWRARPLFRSTKLDERLLASFSGSVFAVFALRCAAFAISLAGHPNLSTYEFPIVTTIPDICMLMCWICFDVVLGNFSEQLLRKFVPASDRSEAAAAGDCACVCCGRREQGLKAEVVPLMTGDPAPGPTTDIPAMWGQRLLRHPMRLVFALWGITAACYLFWLCLCAALSFDSLVFLSGTEHGIGVLLVGLMAVSLVLLRDARCRRRIILRLQRGFDQERTFSTNSADTSLQHSMTSGSDTDELADALRSPRHLTPHREGSGRQAIARRDRTTSESLLLAVRSPGEEPLSGRAGIRRNSSFNNMAWSPSPIRPAPHGASSPSALDRSGAGLSGALHMAKPVEPPRWADPRERQRMAYRLGAALGTGGDPEQLQEAQEFQEWISRSLALVVLLALAEGAWGLLVSLHLIRRVVDRQPVYSESYSVVSLIYFFFFEWWPCLILAGLCHLLLESRLNATAMGAPQLPAPAPGTQYGTVGGAGDADPELGGTARRLDLAPAASGASSRRGSAGGLYDLDEREAEAPRAAPAPLRPTAHRGVSFSGSMWQGATASRPLSRRELGSRSSSRSLRGSSRSTGRSLVLGSLPTSQFARNPQMGFGSQAMGSMPSAGFARGPPQRAPSTAADRQRFLSAGSDNSNMFDQSDGEDDY